MFKKPQPVRLSQYDLDAHREYEQRIDFIDKNFEACLELLREAGLWKSRVSLLQTLVRYSRQDSWLFVETMNFFLRGDSEFEKFYASKKADGRP